MYRIVKVGGNDLHSILLDCLIEAKLIIKGG